jgi:hypothetical protein
MVGQILLNNNKNCYKNFSQKLLKSKQGLSMPCSVRWTCTIIFTRLKTICYYKIQKSIIITLFVLLVYCAESTVRWFIVKEKYCWMAAGLLC